LYCDDSVEAKAIAAAKNQHFSAYFHWNSLLKKKITFQIGENCLASEQKKN
jgi:hypothetical protein